MTKKYKLLGFVPQKRGAGLFWLGLLVLAAAAADQFYLQLLGDLSVVVWGLGGLLIFISILLQLFSRSSSQSAYLQIEEDGIIIDYGGYQLPITHENIDVITGGRISQHHSLKELSRQERRIVEPFFNQTQIFISLHEETEELKEAKQHMPAFMFGTTQIGLLLRADGDDWLTVERAIDGARVEWLGELKRSHEERYVPPGARIWGMDEDDDEDEAFEDIEW